MTKKNSLAQSLHTALLDNDNQCEFASHIKKLNRTEFYSEILRYIEWLDQMNVHSVFVVSTPSIEALCLCFAIILSNRVYIPIHRSTSSELINTYLQDYPVDLLVIQSSLTNQFDYPFTRELQATKDQLFCYKQVSNQHRTLSILPGIIFFTSGSTGNPKAIHYDYTTLNKYLYWCLREFKLSSESSLLFTTELSFVASLRPLFIPTLSGAKTVFIEGQNANILPLITNVLPKITTLNTTPTFLNILVQHCEKNNRLESLAAIHLILLSGEAITSVLINNWLTQINPATIFYNLYGATEYLVPFYKKITGNLTEKEQFHLGQLREGCQYILTEESQLCIAGAIATAYFDPKLNIDNYLFINKQRFIKTNDSVTVLDNSVYYRARSQRLIKRYSQLINLDHIEYALKQDENIPACVAFSDEAQENKIYLMIQATENRSILAHIKHHLKTKLPRYMWPNEYLFSSEIPRTITGKVDYFLLKKKLIQQKPYDLLNYFQQFFHEEVVNRDMKISDLGLDSINYIEMTEAFYKITGKWLNVSKITDKIRISNINSCLEDLPTGVLNHHDRVKLNALQKSIYMSELNENSSDGVKDEITFISCYQLIGKIDTTKFIKAIKETLNNHFLLSSCLVNLEDDYFFIKSPHQQENFILTSPFFFQKKIFDQLAVSIHDDRLINIYLQKRKKTYFLVMSYHHILLDGWSAVLLREEIFRRYHDTPVPHTWNQSVEVEALNQANQIKISQCATDEIKKMLAKIDHYKYNHLEALFNGTLEKNYACFCIEKEKVDRFATANQLSDMPYSVLFAWLLHQMLAHEAKINKIILFMSLSNRNLPIPNAKELLTNLVIGLPIFLDSTDCSAREFAIQIREILSIYFKNMSYSGIEKIWKDEIIDPNIFNLRNYKYPIIYTYISDILKNDYVQNKYIEWPKSFNKIASQKIKPRLFFRVYNMGQHFIIQLSSTINKEIHKHFIDYLGSTLLK